MGASAQGPTDALRPCRARRRRQQHRNLVRIPVVDASGKPWRVAVNMQPSAVREAVCRMMDTLVEYVIADSSTAPLRISPTAVTFSAPLDFILAFNHAVLQSREALFSWQAARDTDLPDKQMAMDHEDTRPVNRHSYYRPVRTGG
jgi:hypothetical protein